MKFLAILMALAVTAPLAAMPASADYQSGVTAKKKKLSYYKKRRAPQVAGYRLRGGYAQGDDLDARFYNLGPKGNLSEYDNRDFSDRVFEGVAHP